MEHGNETCDVCGMVPLAPRLTGATQLVARGAAMQELLKRVARFAASAAPVCVLGETGTGKEIIARLLHANSARAKQPFVAVNVAALPADLLESELFGHGKGAFTGAGQTRRGLFEAADKGTLFLDEVGEMPAPLQAKLLRALQDGEVRRVGETQPFAVDVRIVCATHRDLGQLVQSGQFREDLFYRLKVLSITVPPLRDRSDDVLPLAHQFLRDEGSQARGFTPQAERRLLAYSWPGNVRELQNVVKHGAALAIGTEVGEDELPAEVLQDRERPGWSNSSLLCRTLAEVEREHILRALEVSGGSQSEAARLLGIGRNTLWRKLRAFGSAV